MVILTVLGWALAGLGWGALGCLWMFGKLGFWGGDTIPGSILPVRRPRADTPAPSEPLYTQETLQRGIEDIMEQARLAGNPISAEEARIEALEAIMGLAGGGE